MGLPTSLGDDFLPLIVSWLTVKIRVWVAKLHTDQTVGSSVMKARVVTAGVTWTFSEVSHNFGCGDHGGVGSLSTGSPSGRGAGTPRLNAQSGHSKALIQGSSCAALGPRPEKGEDKGRLDNQPTEIPHVGTFAGHIGYRHVLGGSSVRPVWWKRYRPRVRPKKGAQRYQAVHLIFSLQGQAWGHPG